MAPLRSGPPRSGPCQAFAPSAAHWNAQAKGRDRGTAGSGPPTASAVAGGRRLESRSSSSSSSSSSPCRRQPRAWCRRRGREGRGASADARTAAAAAATACTAHVQAAVLRRRDPLPSAGSRPPGREGRDGGKRAEVGIRLLLAEHGIRAASDAGQRGDPGGGGGGGLGGGRACKTGHVRAGPAGVMRVVRGRSPMS